MVKGHFGEEGMEFSNTGVVNTGFIVSIVEARVGGGGAFLTLPPVVDEVSAAKARGYQGSLLGQLEDSYELLCVEVHASGTDIGTLEDSLGGWGSAQKSQIIAKGIGQEWGVGR